MLYLCIYRHDNSLFLHSLFLWLQINLIFGIYRVLGVFLKHYSYHSKQLFALHILDKRCNYICLFFHLLLLLRNFRPYSCFCFCLGILLICSFVMLVLLVIRSRLDTGLCLLVFLICCLCKSLFLRVVVRLLVNRYIYLLLFLCI